MVVHPLMVYVMWQYAHWRFMSRGSVPADGLLLAHVSQASVPGYDKAETWQQGMVVKGC